MDYSSEYKSPLGTIIMSGDKDKLNGLWFEGQKYFPEILPEKKELPLFLLVKEWLDIYFSGKRPDFNIPVKFSGTDFQNEVWEILCKISYGKTVTYGEIAKEIAGKRGVVSMSAQAVGSAVGHNRISIIVPCHRVIGADGSLVGYAGGVDKKRMLLQLEGVFIKATPHN